MLMNNEINKIEFKLDDIHNESLIRKANDLVSAITNGQDKKEIISNLDVLECVIVSYLDDIEKVAKESKNKDYFIQKQKHEIYRSKFREIRKEIETGNLSIKSVKQDLENCGIYFIGNIG